MIKIDDEQTIVQLLFMQPIVCFEVFETGESYPLGIWNGAWASSRLTAAMAKILIEEQMGFHVRTGEGPGPACSLFVSFCWARYLKQDLIILQQH